MDDYIYKPKHLIKLNKKLKIKTIPRSIFQKVISFLFK
jgi:hypothetical protein